MLFAAFARRVVTRGHFTIIDANGIRHEVGEPGCPGPVIRLHDRRLHRTLALDPRLRLGEAYMAGSLTIESGDLYQFLEICARNEDRVFNHSYIAGLNRLGQTLRFLRQFNPVRRARANARHHYDLPDDLYTLFLDRDRQYSCAYFDQPHDDLDRAQQDKIRHIAAKLLLRPGQRILDIGSGWGGLALHLARMGAREVVGLSLAEHQIEVSRERARVAGLGDRVRFDCRDYREVEGRFDRIVSVGMFEHVGVNHYRGYFERLRELLTDDGVALLHSIGRSDGPGATNPWIRKYIFPGGYAPALSEVLPAVEHAGLWVTDIEILRLHYAETIRLWRRRFDANRARIERCHGERLSRMWEFYLVGAELVFRHGGHMVFQMQLARRQEAVPLTRDYIGDAERRTLADGRASAAA